MKIRKLFKKILAMCLSLAMLSSLPLEFVSQATDEVSNGTLISVDTGKIDTIAQGKEIYSDRTNRQWSSYHPAFEGKEYVYGSLTDTYTVEVLKNCYLYVITGGHNLNNSLAKSLDSQYFQKVDVVLGAYYDNMDVNFFDNYLYEKYVHVGETLEVGNNGIVIASETQLDLKSGGLLPSDDQLAIAKSTTGREVKYLTEGVEIAYNRTGRKWKNVPYYLAGKTFIEAKVRESETIEVTRAGWLYIASWTDCETVAEKLTDTYGFEQVSIPSYQGFSSNVATMTLFRKQVNEGDTFTYDSWAMPIMSGDLVPGEMAVLEPAEGNYVRKIEPYTRVFTDRNYDMGGTFPQALYGQRFIMGSLNEGGKATVTKAGKMYVGIPVTGYDTTTVQAALDAGFVQSTYRPFDWGWSREGMRLYEKVVTVGDTLELGKWSLLIFGATSEDDYYQFPYECNVPEIIPNTGGVYAATTRRFQGIASMNRTDNGRLWAGFLTGGTREPQLENYISIVYSDDDGETWTEAFVARAKETTPGIQIGNIDFHKRSDGSLLITLQQHQEGYEQFTYTYTAVCNNPDAEQPEWSTPKFAFLGWQHAEFAVISSTGEWLAPAYLAPQEDIVTIYSSMDEGETWVRKGSVRNNGIYTCESMIYEQADGTLRMLSRTQSSGPAYGGIMENYSYDGGVHWTPFAGNMEPPFTGPASKFYIGWLDSGNLLMVNHYNFKGRNNMTALLSEDGGKTWPYKLLLDGAEVSYPEAVQAEDGTIYVTHDRNRYTTGEVILHKFTEEDIKAGAFVSEKARQGIVISKVTRETAPDLSDENLFKLDLSKSFTWASSSYDVESTAAAAFDENTSTRWCAPNNSFPQTLTVDLGEIKDIEKIDILFEQEGEWQYTLHVSKDGESWSDYDTNPEEIPRQQEYSHEKEAQARYVSIKMTSGGLNDEGYPCWASIYEMSVKGAEDENYALNQPCAASSVYSQRSSAAAAFDGDYFTRYCASNDAMPQQLMVDLGNRYNIGALHIAFEQLSDWDYTVETSVDGVVWETFVKPEVETIMYALHKENASARYVRLNVNDTSGTAWASVYEMTVYVDESENTVIEDENGAKIEFRGGSLRMDYTDYDKTSLRFGYKIQLPEGATLNSWSWQYTTINPNQPLTGNGINKTVNDDGSINANLVITGIPSTYYNLVLTAKMKIEYTLDGTVYTLEETVVRERSVNIVAENILASQDATQIEKDYATNILQ